MIQHNTRSIKPASVNTKGKQPAKPESVRFNVAAYEETLKKFSVDQLYTELNGIFDGLSDWYLRASKCVAELESRGERLRGLPDLAIIRKIAAGQVSPDVPSVFRNQAIRDEVCRLPIRDQEKLAANPVVAVYEPTKDGKFDTRMVDLTKVDRASKPIVNQVISPEGIRTPEEQKAHLAITAKITPAMKAEKVIAQTAAKFIDEDVPNEPLEFSVTGKVTASEYKMLRVSAAEQGLTMAQLIRRLLLRSGALKTIKSKRQPVSC
jgi:hypothetical protein